ncbi:hypothetical protein A6A08_22960 [Nocardiopsis sp. TSRI0078]|uniref:hypothetical protein n=1 Tax=unclassified Nocardiopsis TaxID=2649073 RepID=UPI00093ECF0C|nr:hypothetical protein [Nocardiopsis sp. TSRI0078]OKI20423.1 hypothetical protein A6A08_22960 [Nocardiopsis sp. TSRI0078]
MKIIKGLSVAGAAGALVLSGFFGGGAAFASESSGASGTTSVEAAAVERRSFSCEWESGNLNFSWDNGVSSTRIYYNNHCSDVRYVTVHVYQVNGGERTVCWRVPTGKGSKLFSKGVGESVHTITRHC